MRAHDATGALGGGGTPPSQRPVTWPRSASASTVNGGKPPPPLAIPPPPGNRHLAQKALKIPGAKGAKGNLYKAPKLIYTVILWYSFVVQCPPPRGGEPLSTACGTCALSDYL